MITVFQTTRGIWRRVGWSRDRGRSSSREVEIYRKADWFTGFLQKKPPYVIVGTTGLILHLTLARPIYAWYDRLGAWVPLVLFLLLLYRYVQQPKRSVPVLLIAAVQIYVLYSVPQFTQEALLLYTGIYEPTSSAMSTAVLLVISGELALLLGYRVAFGGTSNRSNLFDKILPLPTAKWTGTIVIYAVPSLVIYALVSLRPDFIPVSVRFPLSQFFNVYLALVLMLYLGYRFRVRRMRVVAFLSIVAILMAPLLHRFLHKFHLEVSEDEREDQDGDEPRE